MKIPCSGIILAGGLNTRFSGKEKAFVRVGGKYILDRIYDVFCELFDEIILVTNSPQSYLKWDLVMVPDLFPLRSSLTGIHAGLYFSKNPFAFFSACDTPFLKKELIETVLEKMEDDIDIVMPETSAGLEPLCAVYSKRCLQSAGHHLEQNKCKIQRALRKHRTRFVSEKVLREKDPELLSFFNVNTPEDLDKAEEMIVKGRAHSA
jgi:molybdopterin-guanine dinucleotide biosynthesis protein A